MGLKLSHQLILVVAAASMLGVSLANKDWGWNSNKHALNGTEGPQKIIVGTSASTTPTGHSKMPPSYFNDTLGRFIHNAKIESFALLIHYDPPSSTNFPHSVYLFPDLLSYLNCNFKRAKMIANPTQGGGNGFKFVLKRWRAYYFACGERDGGMRFTVVPLYRWPY
ncbi:hypothetical protein GQ457_18G016600 [Hibiscus cannabinus]